jgi:hypothetical protein
MVSLEISGLGIAVHALGRAVAGPAQQLGARHGEGPKNFSLLRLAAVVQQHLPRP